MGRTFLRFVKTNLVSISYKNKGVGTGSLVTDTIYDSIKDDNIVVACMYYDFHTHGK